LEGSSLGFGYLDVQSEKASDYNYYDHYADDVEDVHLVAPVVIPHNSVNQL